MIRTSFRKELRYSARMFKTSQYFWHRIKLQDPPKVKFHKTYKEIENFHVSKMAQETHVYAQMTNAQMLFNKLSTTLSHYPSNSRSQMLSKNSLNLQESRSHFRKTIHLRCHTDFWMRLYISSDRIIVNYLWDGKPIQ